jgi:hypothetical protein
MAEGTSIQARDHLLSGGWPALTAISKAASEMEHGLFGRLTDRVAANARVIRRAPEAIALTGIITLLGCYFAFEHFHRDRVAVLNARIASQERLLADYRTKLKGATPDDAATQIERLTSLLTETQKNLSETKSKPVSADKRLRDPRRLYEDDNAIAEVQDPTIDLDQKRITFPAVNSVDLLQTNKLYEFQNWKLTCGGTRLYNMVSDGGSRQFSYSPLTCKIVGK